MKNKRWVGGFIRIDSKGQQTYIIERKVGGDRFCVSTRAHSKEAALQHLRRFEADPSNYNPSGADKTAQEGLCLTCDLIVEYRSWSVERKGNTKKHAREQGNRLADWEEDLGGIDLRKVSVTKHLKPALDKRKTCRQHRIIALKAFYAWARIERGLLVAGQDPTLDLPVPQASPEKKRRRKVLDIKRVVAARAELEPEYMDCLDLLAATAWHVSELERFIRRPESEIDYRTTGTTIATLKVLHKIGDFAFTPLTRQEHLAAAERLKTRGKVPRRLNATVKAACIKAGVEPFTLGVMRHTVLTWQVEDGALPAEASAFAHHKSERTTREFYLDVTVPTVRVPPRVLADH